MISLKFYNKCQNRKNIIIQIQISIIKLQIMIPALNYVPFRKGNPMIELDMYLFQNIGTINWKSTWCCSRYRTIKGQIVQFPSRHEHPSVPHAKIQMLKVIDKIQDSAKNSSNSMKQMFEETLSSHIQSSNVSIEDFLQYAPKYSNVRKNLYCRQNTSNLQKTAEQIVTNETNYSKTIDH